MWLYFDSVKGSNDSECKETVTLECCVDHTKCVALDCLHVSNDKTRLRSTNDRWMLPCHLLGLSFTLWVWSRYLSVTQSHYLLWSFIVFIYLEQPTDQRTALIQTDISSIFIEEDTAKILWCLCRKSSVVLHASGSHQERERQGGSVPLHLQGHHPLQAAHRRRNH